MALCQNCDAGAIAALNNLVAECQVKMENLEKAVENLTNNVEFSECILGVLGDATKLSQSCEIAGTPFGQEAISSATSNMNSHITETNNLIDTTNNTISELSAQITAASTTLANTVSQCSRCTKTNSAYWSQY